MPPPSSAGRRVRFHPQNPESSGNRMDCQHPHPWVMFNPRTGLSENPVFIHPAATMGCHTNLASDVNQPQWNGSTKTRFPSNLNAAQQFPASTSDDSDTDASICLTAKQLKAQVNDFIKVYDEFYRLYESEVAKIKPYVDDDILQKAWLKKIEYNEKYNTGRGQEQKQLSTQRKMLAACLSQIDSATRSDAIVRPLSDPSRYDRRGIYLEKIQAAGHRVLRLADMTMSSRSACEDLRSELSDLGKLVDPKNKDAKILYQFDRRETVNSQGNNKDATGDGGIEVQADNQSSGGGENSDNQGDDPTDNQNDLSNQNDSWAA